MQLILIQMGLEDPIPILGDVNTKFHESSAALPKMEDICILQEIIMQMVKRVIMKIKPFY